MSKQQENSEKNKSIVIGARTKNQGYIAYRDKG
jgi:hypothetical protein